jgi:DNA mismatch repair protein MutS
LASKDKEVKETPLMKQYNEIKGSILMLVCCLEYDFTDIHRCQLQNIGITLTKRGAGSNRDRIGWFSTSFYNTYLPKLVKAGLRVAICDQLEDPKKNKKHCGKEG